MAKRRSPEERLEAYAKAYRELAGQLAETGYLWKGTIVRQRMTCGKAKCPCHSDPRRRHGPYAYWTSKVKRKTVSRYLKPQEANLYEEWIENRRRLDKVQRKMIALSKKIAPLILEKEAQDDLAEKGS